MAVHEYNEDTALSRYIENILRDNYIPTVRILDRHMDAVPGESYILGGHFYKNTQKVSTYRIAGYSATVKKSSGIKTLDGEDTGTDYERISDEPYIFGKEYKNLTTNYISNSGYYSSDLHEHLGDYLRAYRDYTHIDLMNLYNCYSDRHTTNFSLPISLDSAFGKLRGAKYDSSKKLIVFHVEPDCEYLIKLGAGAVSCAVQLAMWNGKALLSITDQGNTAQGQEGYIYFPPIKFPYSNGLALSVTPQSLTSALYSNRRYLYAFLEIPATYDGAISILEEPKYTRAINRSLETLGDESVPYSDKLIEYLTGNVITLWDNVKSDIKRVQEILSKKSVQDKYFTNKNLYTYPLGDKVRYGDGAETTLTQFAPGVFDKDMQRAIYNAFYDQGISDFMGYIDKDVETLLNRIANER